MTDEQNSLVDTSNLDSKIKDIATKVINEDDTDATKDLVALFNWNMSKKNVSRILKLNSLLDDVSDQMVLRFQKRADQFTNSDLLDYMKVIQGAIDTSSKSLNQVEDPPMIVQQTNTQINVNVMDGFDRESKERILAAIQATLQAKPQQPKQVDFVDTTNEQEDKRKDESND